MRGSDDWPFDERPSELTSAKSGAVGGAEFARFVIGGWGSADVNGGDMNE